MLTFLSVGLPVMFIGIIAILTPIFERMLDRFPGLEKRLFHLMGQ